MHQWDGVLRKAMSLRYRVAMPLNQGDLSYSWCRCDKG
jgi:hypothetical protein